MYELNQGNQNYTYMTNYPMYYLPPEQQTIEQEKEEIQRLHHQLSQKQTELKKAKNHLEELQRETVCRRCRKGVAFDENGSRNGLRGPTKKVLRKDIRCQMAGCERRYSSKIALRYHIRTVHLNQEAKEDK